MTLRRTLLALPLVAAGCAGHPAPDSPPARFATALEHANTGIGQAIARMDAFETLARRESAAIAFANGGRRAAPPRVGPPEAGIAEATGRVVAPAYAALGQYAMALAQLAAGEAVVPQGPDTGAALAAEAERGLAQARVAAGVVVPASIQQPGLAGIAALAALPHRLAAGRPAGLQAVVAEAEPQVAAVAALLRSLIETASGGGVRAALRARREALDRDGAQFLAAVGRDPRLDPAERYALYRGVAGMRDDDPAPGTFAAITAVTDSMARAHATLGGPNASAEVAGFEAAVAQLGVLVESSRRQQPSGAR